MKTALVLGAGGFIGSHLVVRLKREGFWVRGVDLKRPRYEASPADEFVVGDLRDLALTESVIDRSFDEVYQLAADMGGAGFVFSGANDADIMHNSAQINLNVLECLSKHAPGVVFYSSSACMYPEHNQLDPNNPNCAEDSAYPANPDSEYGWEKLFSERLFLAYQRNRGLNVRIGRFHNIFGPLGSWNDGREKAPAALCRKIAMADAGGEIEMWGDGSQTRSFLYIDECLEGVLRLTRSEFVGPVNIGSDEMVSLKQFAHMIMEVGGKSVQIKHIPGPLGVRGRNSDNRLIQEKLGWAPNAPLRQGLEQTYRWIRSQIEQNRRDEA